MELNMDTLLSAIQDTGVARLRDTVGLDPAQATGAVQAVASSLVDQLPSGAASLTGMLSSLAQASGSGGNPLAGLVDPSAMASAVAERIGVGADTASAIVQTLLPLLQETLVKLLPGGGGVSEMLGGFFGD